MRESFHIHTPGRSLTDVTARVNALVKASGITDGLCTVFIHHTSASLIISENADPTVLGDLEAFIARLVVDGDPIFKHTDEGKDDMSAHVRSVLTATSLSVPVAKGALDLGTWQAIYVWEHRKAPHQRRLSVVIA